MSGPTQPDPDAGARFLETLLTGDPARLDVATDEPVIALMDADGVEGGTPDTVDELRARMERILRERATAPGSPGHVRPIAAGEPAPASAKKATARAAWVAGALVVAAAAAVLVTEGAEMARRERRGPDDIGPDKPPQPLTDAQRASRLREEAFALCASQDLAGCGLKLDEAKALDPARERDPRVTTARAQVLPPAPEPAPLAPLPVGPGKPPVGPVAPLPLKPPR